MSSAGSSPSRQRRLVKGCILFLWILVGLTTWKLETGTCFSPRSTTIFHRRTTFSRVILRDAESPVVANTTNPGSPSSSTTTASTPETNATESPIKITKTKNVPLNMPPSSITDGRNNKKKNSQKYYVNPEDLAKLQESIDIVSLIECYDIPQFTRSGDRASCLCPFHDDHNPSLKIDGNRGIFKCFSCGMGGNALRFVREYAKVHGTELSVLEAVKLLDDMVTTSSSSNSKPILPADITVPMGARPPASSQKNIAANSNQTLTKKASQSSGSYIAATMSTTSRDRVLLANLHAAAYFEECLLNRLDAGSARAHLRTRGISPNTVKAFAIGFAPETYFTGQQNKAWGEGSLVHHLRDKGFAPQEIVDAGLSIRTKRGKQQLEEIQKNNGNETAATSIAANDYSTLMDRFRGRLVVPIFDAKGSYVLGFGGRILESTASGSDFKAAKYLNSPESVIFQKKTVLFGQHMAEKPVHTPPWEEEEKAKVAPPLIVVEGYMDAIAMWQAGLRETVASMGTALSLEQLLSAANSARKLGGRVVLCLDNDDAGVAAVERLCTGKNPILYSATQTGSAEFYVAELPKGVKDPAEFLESNRDDEHLDEKFRNEVIKNAVEWTGWYSDRVISSFNASASSGEKGSFSEIFDQLGSFLSVFEDTDQRNKRASRMSPGLARLLDSGNEEESSSTEIGAKCAQLESDLLHKSSAILHSSSMRVQGAVEIHDDSVDSERIWRREPAVSKSLEMSQVISAVEGPMSNKRKEKKNYETETLQELEMFDDAPQPKRPYNKRRRLRMKRSRRAKNTPKSMTPHVRGVQSNRLDDEWLGASADKSFDERNHLRYDIHMKRSKDGAKRRIGPESIVRFNHNQYHGTWKTEQASTAGYHSGGIPPKNLDFLEKGTSSLVEINEEDVTNFAEDMLLRLLVRFPEARKTLSESLRVSEASGSSDEIRWSRADKQWLFKCLIEDQEKLPQDTFGSEQLGPVRSNLLKRTDLFPGALNEPLKHNVESAEAATRLKPLESSTAKHSRIDQSSVVDVEFDDLASPGSEVADVESSANNLEKSTEASGEIPNIGDDWLDFAQMDGDMPNDVIQAQGRISDQYLDSVPFSMGDEAKESQDTEVIAQEAASETSAAPMTESETKEDVSIKDKADSLDADFVSYEATSVTKGSLEYLFLEQDEKLETFFHVEPEDSSRSQDGDHNTKATWAVQDLYTILETNSVLQRIQAGRQYIIAQQQSGSHFDSIPHEGTKLLDGSTESTGTDIVSKETSKQSQELAQYCSPDCPKGGLRHDLHRVQTLLQSNQRAMNRIYSLILADFSDQTVNTRGYNWLMNVLRFNDMKMVQWSDIIESKEGFQHSNEEIEDLEDNLSLDWNELSNTYEMWDWNKNVETNHASHVAERLETTEHNPESPDEVFERMEDEWGWMEMEGAGDDNHDDGYERAVEESDANEHGMKGEDYEIDENSEIDEDYHEDYEEHEVFEEEIEFE